METFTISDQYGEYSTLRGEEGKPVVLGRGGFGITICAFKLRKLGDVEIRDDFALKILRDNAIEDSKVRSRILKEILALRDLQHPNLASYKDCGEEAGCVFLVMELCRGGDLAALAARVGALPERFALQAILQVCAGLDEAHRKGYLHRDLKPTNILISEELPPEAGLPWLEERMAGGYLRFKVVDFGLAGRLESEVRGGGFMGSPMFASPEQVREQRLDSRSDIYSLGMTLWYLATGKGPLLNANNEPVVDAREAMRRHTSSSQHDLAFQDHFSEGFRSLLGRMVRKAPDERFRSAQELADAIRRQIEAMPAPQAGLDPQPANVLSPGPLPANPATWGTGTFSEYYHVLKKVGKRAIGTFYQARQKASGNTVGFTAWIAANSPNAASEKLIGQHLDRLKSVTNDAVAPKVITRIVDWLRTANEWCVAEEWNDGEKLARFALHHGRTIATEDVARLLWPVAYACDFLHDHGVDSALLSVDEIRLLSPLSEPDDSSWIERSIDEWGDWTIRLSALSVPQVLDVERSGADPLASSSTSAIGGCDAGQLRFSKSFCRLLYRMMEGADPAVAADWDAQAFTPSARLTAESNALLRDYICGTYADDANVDILKRICSYEGVARISGQSDAIMAPSAPPTRATPVGRAGAAAVTPSASPTPSGESTSKPAGGSTAHLKGGVAPTARGSAGSSRSIHNREPILDAAPTSQVEVARLIPGKPGWVKSPYGARREQQVRGPEWRENAHVMCQTGRPFQLPAELPPLEAILIEGKFDTVLTPYVEPHQEIAVPSGKWEPNAEITCAVTGRPLVQPSQLPYATATTIEDRPGVVKSPYADRPEIVIETERWRPGEMLACPATGQMFALPAVLPALLAIPGKVPGSFTSPYASDKPFKLPAAKCVPGYKFPCPLSGQPLALPSCLPDEWQFEGIVRQADVPETRSPYIELDSEGGQPLDAADWVPGASIKCLVTGRPFILPATLPVLKVKAGPIPFSVCSPFPPHETVTISPQDWTAGAELQVRLDARTECRVTLPRDLPFPDRVELSELDSVPQGLQPQARGSCGTIRSPFVDNGDLIEVPAQQWSPGVRVTCPSTSRPFWLPTELPPLEARPGPDLGTVHSPFTDRVVKIPATEWIGGNSFPCPETGAKFVLPHNLPLLAGRVDESHPGYVESPFDLGSAYLVEFAEWKAGEILECPTSKRKFALPQSLPEWIPEAECDAANPGMVRNPHGPGSWFKVSGADWEAGAIVQCPETQAKLALPENLPAMEAILADGMPGYVQTPYTSRSEPIRVHSSKWRGGNLIACPLTKRFMRMPDELPSLPSAFAPVHKLLAEVRRSPVSTSLIGVGILAAILFFLLKPPPPPPVVFDTKARSIFGDLGKPTHVPPVTPHPLSAMQWPDTVVIEQGFSPKETKVFLRLPDGAIIDQVKVAPSNGSVERERIIKLREALNKLTDNPALKTLKLSFEAPGYNSESIFISRAKSYKYQDQRITLKRLTGAVSWPATDPFYLSFYQKIRFVPQDESKRDGDRDEYPEAFGKGMMQLPTGKYAVTFIGKTNLTKDWRQKKITVKVEDRSLYPSAGASEATRVLNIEEGKDTNIATLPQSVHRYLAGSGSYKWEMESLITNKKKASEVGKKPPSEYDLHYWSPCVLKFNNDFTGGEFIDENNLLSCGVDRFLDALMAGALQKECELSKVEGWAKAKSYPEVVEILKRLATILQPPPKFSSVTETENGIKGSRMEIFDLEEKAWKLATSILGKNLNVMIEDAELKPTEEGNYPEFHDWFIELKKSMLRTSWNSTSSIIMSERPTLAVLKDLDLLAQPLTVGAKKGVPGYFVKQPFVVTKVDENGQVHLEFEALATKVPYVGERNRGYLHADLIQKQSKSKILYYIAGIFDGDNAESRTITLTPIEN